MQEDHNALPYFSLTSHESALEHLFSALSGNQGIIKLLGESGIGKTALCHELSRRLGNDTSVLFFDKVPGSPDELQDVIAWTLDLDREKSFIRAFGEALHNTPKNRLILIFDNADFVDEDTFLAIRMLTNIQNRDSMLVQVVLSGRPLSAEVAQTNENDELASYIASVVRISALPPGETETLFVHTLEMLQPGERILTPPGLRELQRITAGNPQRIIDFARRILAFDNDVPQAINAQWIQAVELGGWPQTKARWNMPPWVFGWLRTRPVKLSVMGAIVFLLGLALWPSSEDTRPPAEDTLADSATSAEPQDNETADNSEARARARQRYRSMSRWLQSRVSLDALQVMGFPPEARALNAPPTVDPVTLIESPSPEYRLEQALASWLDHWASQSVTDYLGFYHEDFQPAYHDSREAWRADRQERLRSPENITIDYRDLEILDYRQNGATHEATLRFWMEYSTPSYADETWKELRFRAASGEPWRILEERTLEVNRLR